MPLDPDLVAILTGSNLGTLATIRRDGRPQLSNINYCFDVSAVAASRDDATVEELIEVYRLVGGKEHPDWDDYRRAMVEDRRMVARLHVTHLYGKVA